VKDWYQPIAKNVFTPLYALKDGSKVLTYLKEYEKTQYHSTEEIKERQWNALKDIISHAYKNCEYYQRKFDSIDLHPSDVKEINDFENVPILTKRDIQEYEQYLLAKNIPRMNIIKNFTGGSTGSPLKLYVDNERMDMRMAGNIRHDRWAGKDIGDKVACIWGATVDFKNWHNWKARLRNRLTTRMLYLDTTLMNRETFNDFVNQINKYKPRFFLAYANAAALFARYITEKNLVGHIKPEAIITSAEVLTPDNRELIEKTFGCNVYDNYGCREVSTIASECDHHHGLHINSESIYLEFVRKSKAVNPGEVGETLVTDLYNKAMPLIRYEIGDVGIPAEAKCGCGRGLPVMQMAAGRVTDFLVGNDGRIVSGVVLSTYLITRVSGMEQLRFLQDNVGEICIQIVKNHSFKEENITTLKQLVKQFLGEKVHIDIEFTESIPKEVSGKYRFTISSIDPLEYLI